MVNFNPLFDPRADAGMRFAESYNAARDERMANEQAQEQQEYQNLLGGALMQGDYDAARAAAYGRGDIETGMGIDQQVASQQAAQAEATAEQRALLREAMESRADQIDSALRMEDPAQRQRALAAITSSLQIAYPSVAQGIGENAAELAALSVEDPETAIAAFGQVREQSQPNLQSKVVTGEDGNRYYANFNPRTGEYDITDVRAPEPSNNTADIIKGVLDADAQNDLLMQDAEAARETISASQSVLDTVNDLEAALEQTGPGSVGLMNDLRQAGQGIQSQISALAGYGVGGQAIANYAQNAINDNNVEDSVRELFLDPNLSSVDFLANTLAYAIARQNDPGGRLSDADVRSVRQNMGLGRFSSDEQLASALATVRMRANRSLTRAQAEYDRLRGVSGSTGRQSEMPPVNADGVRDFTDLGGG